MIGQIWPQIGITGLWHLEDVNDASGNGYNLTNYGSVAFGAGKFGNCAQFGASNSSKYLRIASSLGIDLNATNLTMMAWVYPQTAPGTDESQEIVDWRSTTGGDGVAVLRYYDDAGTKILRYQHGTNSAEYNVSLALNTWHFVVGVTSGSNIYLYLNGNLVGSSTFVSVSNTYNFFTVGARYRTSADYYFKGNIDEVVAFNLAWSASKVRKWYGWCRGMLI